MKIKWKKQSIIKGMEYVIAFFVILSISLYFIQDAFIQNDVFFDIKTGEEILKHGVDMKDHFSFIPGLIYTYHHWLYDVILFLLYKKFGFVMLKYVFTFVFFLFGTSVFFANKKLTKSTMIGILSTALTMYLATNFLQTRVQSISYGLLILEYYCLEKLYSEGKKRYFIPLFLIGIIIANFHMPIWILTLVFFLPFLAEMILFYITTFWKKKNNYEIEKPANWKYILIAFVLVGITGLCTPLKFYPYIFFLQCMDNETYTFINEMQKTALITYQKQLILLFVAFIGFYFKIFKLKIRDFCLFIGLLLIALMARRHVVYITIFTPLLLVKSINWDLLKEFGKEFYKKWKHLTRKVKWIKKIRKQTVIDKKDIYMLLLIIPVVFLPFVINHNIKGFQEKDIEFEIKVNYPYETVKYIKENIDYKNTKIHNSFNFGSYLEFYDIPVFIDSRAEVYMREYNGGKDIINDYLKSKKFKTYKMYFNSYGFEYALVDKGDDIFQLLSDDEDFELIYQESYYAFFKRISKEND